MAHGTHDLRGVVRRRASEVDVAQLQSCPTLDMFRPDDQYAQQLAVRSATLRHVFHNVVVIVLGGLIIDLQDLVDPDDGARGADLDSREGEHGTLPRRSHALHADGHATDHAHGADCVIGSLDGHWNAQDQHAVKLERTLGLLNGRDLAETIVGALVACEPDVQDWVLVGIIAHAPVPHRLVELLREGVLCDTEVIGQVAEVEAPVFA
mmetsp:Transcript_130952/g.292896  ORF Transcript_130952/g.292896 Transcript_130952/m.292896 type:complete len:208 (+) Transcript_130952:183-806(+)